MDSINGKLIQDLIQYLGDDYDESQLGFLTLCANRSIISFSSKRNYPITYSDDMRKADMERYYACLFDLSLYWIDTQGNEFEKSHSENGTSRTWYSESDISAFHNVIPISIFV